VSHNRTGYSKKETVYHDSATELDIFCHYFFLLLGLLLDCEWSCYHFYVLSTSHICALIRIKICPSNFSLIYLAGFNKCLC
jgi:hypothetical protein